jgi:uncharacterized protein YjbI with pentapeptide repeats
MTRLLVLPLFGLIDVDYEDYLARLKQGVHAWNEWRKANYDIRPYLHGADLRGADLRGANLSWADLGGANLSGANLSGANLSWTDLSWANLSEADLRGANLSGTDFSWAHLSEAHLSGADLRGANLSGTDLRGAHLSETHLRGALLRGTDLRGADLRGAHLGGAHLRGADLSGADLSGAHLSGTDLRGAHLSWANLSGADLGGANLRGTDLIGADLSGADLIGADLIGADLSGADLSMASLIDAQLHKAILTDSCLWETQRAGWSIKGAHCKRVFFDRNSEQATHFAAGEFERLYAEQTKIVLHYEGGINPIEVATLPALIQRLEKSYEGCRLRLQSIQDNAGGATVTIVVDDVGQHGLSSLREAAAQIQQLQLMVRENEEAKIQLQAQINLMLEKIFPIMLEGIVSRNTYEIHTNGPVGAIGTGSQGRQHNIYSQNDLADIRKLVDSIGEQRASLERSITDAKLSELQQSLQNLQEQLIAQIPDHSIIQSSLKSLKTIFEGAAGRVLGSVLLELLRQIG